MRTKEEILKEAFDLGMHDYEINKRLYKKVEVGIVGLLDGNDIEGITQELKQIEKDMFNPEHEDYKYYGEYIKNYTTLETEDDYGSISIKCEIVFVFFNAEYAEEKLREYKDWLENNKENKRRQLEQLKKELGEE